MAEKTVSVRLLAITNQYKAAMADAGRATGSVATTTQAQTGKMNSSWSGVGGSVGGVVKTMGAFAAGGAAFQALSASIDEASTLEESVNAVRVTFGNAAEDVLALGDNSARSFGLSRSELNQTAVGFAGFADTIAGATGQQIHDVIEDLVGRTADFASVMDTTVPDAARIMMSTLAGESEVIRRKMGADISAAAVEHHLLTEGIVDSASAITEADKQYGRYLLLMEETDKMVGDFVNTADSAANSQRVMAANVKNAAAILGDEYLPMVAAVTTGLSELLELAPKIAEADFFPGLPGSASIGDVNSFGRDLLVNPAGAADTVIEDFKSLIGVSDDAAISLDGMYASSRTAGGGLADAAREAAAASRQLGTDYSPALRDAQTELDRAAKRGIRLGEALVEAKEAAEQAAEQAAEAAERYRDRVAGAFSDAESAVSSFSDESMGDLDAWQQELLDDANAIASWQGNLTTIAGETSAEFALFLADMGLAGAGLVEEMANNEGELEESFANWTWASAIASRDMAAEFANVSPAVRRELEAMGIDVDVILSGIAASSGGAAADIGAAIGQGIKRGLDGQISAISGSARFAVEQALRAAKGAALVASPSRRFADEVGRPIAEGIAVGIDDGAARIADSIVDALDDAAQQGVERADRLVDTVSGRLSDRWRSLDDRRNMAGQLRSITDAEERLADARGDARSTLSEYGKGSEEYADALDRVRDAQLSLEDANYRYLKSVAEAFEAGEANEKQFRNAALAAGLSRGEIETMIAEYRRLRSAQADADKMAAKAMKDLDGQAAETVRKFSIWAGLDHFSAGAVQRVKELAKSDPDAALKRMATLVAGAEADLSAYMGGKRASGGPTMPGRLYEVNENGPEFFHAEGRSWLMSDQYGRVQPMPPGLGDSNRMMAGGVGGGPTYNVTVHAGMGTNGHDVGRVIVENIRRFERSNGSNWRMA